MSEDVPGKDFTLLLKRLNAGDTDAAERVSAVVYDELKRLAAFAIPRDNGSHSLQPTLLVNEALMRLIQGQPVDWQDRKHFYMLAGRLMRRIVIDYFRSRSAQKRPPPKLRLSLEDVLVFDDDRRDEVLMMDQALERLAEIDSRAARVVELRYFAGYTIEQVAEILHVDSRTVTRDWKQALWWLREFFETDEPDAVV